MASCGFRVRVRAHTAGAVREVPGPGGRVPVQHAGPAPEPVPEARQQGRPQQREGQEERLVRSLLAAAGVHS